MSTTARIIVAASLAVLALPALATELANHGPHGEYFYNPYLQLYFFDPAIFADQGRAVPDRLATYSAIWEWATAGEIHALVSCNPPDGWTLEGVMGPRQFTLGNGGPRWIGYYDNPGDPNGVLIESDFAPDFPILTGWGFQGSAENWGAGAWLMSSTDPVAAPRLTNLGGSGEYFHDLGTGLYWYDPAQFVGQTREQIEAWLGAAPDWRWATADEIYGLLGKASADDLTLTGIMGAPQFTIGNGGPRWIGYYALATQPDGILIEANTAPFFHLLISAGTQSNVVAWNPGAWLVSPVDPTPVESSSWGEVKATYR